MISALVGVIVLTIVVLIPIWIVAVILWGNRNGA